MALLLTPSPRLRYAGAALRRQALGIGFLAVVAALIGLSVLVYNHAFTPTAPVYLTVANAGDQLTLPAQVQLRGITVGEVVGERVLSDGVRLHLAMKPGDLKVIPANVSAEILPETLFGEKYVNLVVPAVASPAHLASGAVIGLDRSTSALEVETVFNNLLPFLSYVQPAQLNQTLSAIASALQGQSTALGQNLVLADEYLKKLNVHLPAIDTDLDRLGPVVNSYASAAPALLGTLAHLSTNARTVSATQDQLAGFLSAAIGSSGTATTVLTRNATDLIALANDSQPGLAALQEYSAEFPCLTNGLSALEPRLNQAFAPNGELHITLLDDVDRGGYTAANAPTYQTPYQLPGPECYGLNSPTTTRYNVGYPGPPAGNYPPGTSVEYPPGTHSGSGSSGSGTASSAYLQQGNVGAVGSPAEQAEVADLMLAGGGAPVSATDVGLSDVLMGPMLRGTQVDTSG